jgi:hypothetical protein
MQVPSSGTVGSALGIGVAATSPAKRPRARKELSIFEVIRNREREKKNRMEKCLERYPYIYIKAKHSRRNVAGKQCVLKVSAFVKTASICRQPLETEESHKI